MENIVLHLKLVRGVERAPLAYVVRNHVKVTHISPGYSSYLNLKGEIIARAPIVNAKSNLKLAEKCLDRAYLRNIDYSLVYQVLLKVFMDMDYCVCVKQRRSMQDCEAEYFYIHQQVLGPDHVTRQVVEAKR